ncbi:MAG: glycosyltransferase family 4 protein [Desulfobulbus sp.]
MRIGIDSRTLTFPELRGIANYILEILKNWPESNDEFVLFYEDGQLSSNIVSPAKITSVKVPEPPGTRFKSWNWIAMPLALKKVNIDLIWCPANIPIPFTRRRQILTVHDTLLQEPFRKHSPFNNIFYRYIVPYWTRQFADEIITVSNFSRKRIDIFFKLNPNKINVIYNGLPSVDKQFSSKREAQNNLFQNGIISGKYIYALGAESYWKNTELLLKSFAMVHEDYPNLSLVISGIQNFALEKYRQMASDLGLNSAIKLIKFVDSVTRNTLYQGAEIFIYPSLFEGFGFPPLEAMALGCPVIASDNASIPEVVGNAAYSVDCTHAYNLSSAIIILMEDVIKRRELINRGYKNISNFSWQKSARLHRKVFEQGSL